MADDEEKETGGKPHEESADKVKSLAKRKAEDISEWLLDVLADFQPVLRKLSEVEVKLPLHRMEPEVAKKALDNVRDVRIKEIEADLSRMLQEDNTQLTQQEMNLKFERETGRAERHERRLVMAFVLTIVLGGGLSLLFNYLGSANLASTAFTLVVTITTILVNKLVGRPSPRRRRAGRRRALPARSSRGRAALRSSSSG